MTIKLQADILQRLHILAEKKGTGYQTRLRDFIVERLYEEDKREAIIGG